MNALLASAILALLSPQKGTVQVNVNAKTGETITGERTFRVTVTSKNAVTGVEFYFGNDLRDKDTSTPYQFTIDSLAENDGDAKLKFKAFTTEGESGEVSITVKIDNGASKGLDFHLAHGMEALQDGKYAEAATSGRIALKIDSKSTVAKVLVARAYLGLGTLDKAQKYAEDAVEASPNDQGAADILSTIKLRQAFRTMSAGSDHTEALNVIKEALTSAVETRRKFVDRAFDALTAPTGDDVVPYADAALADGRFAAAVSVLQPAFLKDNRRSDVGNRLAFALIRLGRNTEALQTLEGVKKNGAPDANTFGMLAVVNADLGNADESDSALKDALLADGEAPAVLSAQAYIALKYVRHKLVGKTTLTLNYDDIGGNDAQAKANSRAALRDALTQMEKSHGESSITSYYRSALNNKLEEFQKGEDFFESAVLADPLNVDAYIEQGNRSLGTAQNGKPTKEELDTRLGAARAYYNAALAGQPTSAAALAGLCVVATMEGKPDEAITWGQAAVKAQPTYAAGFVALGTAYNLGSSTSRTAADKLRQTNQTVGLSNAERQANELKTRQLEAQASTYARNARDAGNSAAKIDSRVEGYELTKVFAAWRYLYTGGRMPVLPLPK